MCTTVFGCFAFGSFFVPMPECIMADESKESRRSDSAVGARVHPQFVEAIVRNDCWRLGCTSPS